MLVKGSTHKNEDSACCSCATLSTAIMLGCHKDHCIAATLGSRLQITLHGMKTEPSEVTYGEFTSKHAHE
jgi:hypothetical protein